MWEWAVARHVLGCRFILESHTWNRHPVWSRRRPWSPSSSPPVLPQPLLLPERPVLVPVFSKWNGSTSHKILLFFSAGLLYLQTTGILPPSADCTFLKCRLILIQVCIFITPFKEKCLGMPLSYAGIIDSHYQSRLT